MFYYFNRVRPESGREGDLDGNPDLLKLTPFATNFGFFISYLESVGVFHSSDERVVNARGQVLPLLTNSFLHWFETASWGEQRLLELGSGSSTFYFAKHFRQVTSFENNERWYGMIKSNLPANVDYRYAASIRDALAGQALGEFDAILLDAGENRARLARLIADSDFSGAVFLDNADWYRRSAGLLAEAGYVEIPFFGIKPVQSWVSCTSVLARKETLAGIFGRDWRRVPELSRPNADNPWDDESAADPPP